MPVNESGRDNRRTHRALDGHMKHGGKAATTMRRSRAAAFGAIAGALFGIVVLLGRNSEWVLGWLLGAPLYAADILHEVLRTPEWLFSPLVCVYFALLGSIVGVVVAARRQQTLGIIILLMGVLLGGHAFLSLTGARHVFDRVFSDLEKFDWTTIDWREVLGEESTPPEPDRDDGQH